MGIVNVTPDSFSDTGAHFSPSAAIAHARGLFRDGAAILDLGAEASSFFRPGIGPVDADEQLRRLRPVLSGLQQGCPATALPVPMISIDTRSAEVAREAVRLGAHTINDISAGTADSEMLPTAAALGVPIILMHISPGYPETPPHDEADIVQTVLDYLLARADAALAAGVRRENILLDPGLGFGKTMPDNWRLVLEVRRLLAAGFPVLLGASRKRFLAEISQIASPELQAITAQLTTLSAPAGAHERDLATAAVTVFAARAGVPIQRVHNVKLCRAALAMAGLVG